VGYGGVLRLWLVLQAKITATVTYLRSHCIIVPSRPPYNGESEQVYRVLRERGKGKGRKREREGKKKGKLYLLSYIYESLLLTLIINEMGTYLVGSNPKLTFMSRERRGKADGRDGKNKVK
jgi:hypothetical protein